ncbi:MAG TPA: DUF5681 domain-containing protein [Rhodanobacteraceae bacterium]|nr:DUF5681 domain-containing protein [Rhodanobacteraceae bacterium]
MATKTHKGRFQPGKSGNPSGRPKGVPDRRNELRELITPHVPELLEKALAMARDGDVNALRLLLDRSVPPLKQASAARPFDLGDGKELADLGRAILKAVSKGDLTPDIGRELIDALSAQCKLIEVDEIMRRLEAIENKSP